MVSTSPTIGRDEDRQFSLTIHVPRAGTFSQYIGPAIILVNLGLFAYILYEFFVLQFFNFINLIGVIGIIYVSSYLRHFLAYKTEENLIITNNAIYIKHSEIIRSDKGIYAKNSLPPVFTKIPFNEMAEFHFTVDDDLGAFTLSDAYKLMFITKGNQYYYCYTGDKNKAFELQTLQSLFMETKPRDPDGMPTSSAEKGSDSCSYCGASFIKKMAVCPQCGAQLS